MKIVYTILIFCFCTFHSQCQLHLDLGLGLRHMSLTDNNGRSFIPNRESTAVAPSFNLDMRLRSQKLIYGISVDFIQYEHPFSDNSIVGTNDRFNLKHISMSAYPSYYILNNIELGFAISIDRFFDFIAFESDAKMSRGREFTNTHRYVSIRPFLSFHLNKWSLVLYYNAPVAEIKATTFEKPNYAGLKVQYTVFSYRHNKYIT